MPLDLRQRHLLRARPERPYAAGPPSVAKNFHRCKVLNAIDAGRVYETPDGKIGTLPEDANIIPLASAKAKARTADTKDE